MREAEVRASSAQEAVEVFFKERVAPDVEVFIIAVFRSGRA